MNFCSKTRTVRSSRAFITANLMRKLINFDAIVPNVQNSGVLTAGDAEDMQESISFFV